MLPLMIIVFAGVFYVSTLVSTAHRTLSVARSCAWRAAMGACESIPPECPQSSADDESTLKSRAKDAGAPVSIDMDRLAAEEGDQRDERSKGVLADIGAQLNQLFSGRYEARVEEQFGKSKILGGEQVTVDSSFSLPCNTKPGTAEGLADSLFEKFEPPDTPPEPKPYKDPNDRNNDS